MTGDKWFVGEVMRPDAGDPLYAPVRWEGDKLVEFGVTPSHSISAMQEFVDLINQSRGPKLEIDK